MTQTSLSKYPPYVRVQQIVGRPEVSEEQAEKNRKRGKGIQRPRPEIPGIYSMGRSTWFAGVKAGRFPTPAKYVGHIPYWRTEDVLAIGEEQG